MPFKDKKGKANTVIAQSHSEQKLGLDCHHLNSKAETNSKLYLTLLVI